MDADEPARECRDFFTAGDGKAWLDAQIGQVETELENLLQDMSYISRTPSASWSAARGWYPRSRPSA